MKKVTLIVLASLLFTLAAGTGWAAGAPSQTAQSIMVVFNNSGTFAIVGTQVWKLNITNAAGNFTNTFDGTITCDATGNNTCAVTNAPPAPLPNADAVTGNGGPNGIGNIGRDGVVGDEKCIMLAGGTLYAETYKQDLSTGSGANKVTYTYRYSVAPDPAVDIDPDTAGVQVGPFTGWDLFQDNTGGTTAHIDVNAFIAGESVVKNKTVGTKYSFSIVEPDLSNRVQNLALTITDGNGNFVATVYPGSTVVNNTPGSTANPTVQWADVFLPNVAPNDDGSLDFWYKQNAGTNIAANGSTQLLVNNIDARNLLNGVGSLDTFPGNNNGGADGSALAGAVMDQQGFDLPAGDYTLTLTGIVKGNNALADLSFNVTSTVHIVGAGCGPVQ